ncbi:MAG: HEAT repeat domain-containing protein [Planctomycetes bacterium]|nr:HEAT repeat domain-containing protein [Planctomycetota bacterium]
MRMVQRLAGVAALLLMLPAPLRGGEGQAEDPTAIPGLSKEAQGGLRELLAKIAQMRKEWGGVAWQPEVGWLPKELKRLFSSADLIAIAAGSRDPELPMSAFQALDGPSLGKAEVELLIGVVRTHKENWRRMWAALALPANERFGVPALEGLLDSPDRFTRVYAARALNSRGSKASPQLRRRAQLLLLEALANDDDSSREAHNGVQPLEPWMTEWLAERVGKAECPKRLREHGIALLAYQASKESAEVLRRIFVAGVADGEVNVRISAVNGLRRMGITEADLPLLRKVASDEAPDVRRMLYAGLADIAEPWTAPVLLAGLEDKELENAAICAGVLARLKWRPAVPALMKLAQRAPRGENQPFDDAYRAACEAVTEIAALTGYDFERRTVSTPFGRGGRAHVIQNRSDVWRKECARLIEWWKQEEKAWPKQP